MSDEEQAIFDDVEPSPVSAAVYEAIQAVRVGNYEQADAILSDAQKHQSTPADKLERGILEGKKVNLNEASEMVRQHRDAHLSKIQGWDDLMAIPEVEWVLEDLLPVGGLSLIIGDPKAGKSTFARCLTAYVAGLSPQVFLNRLPTESKVLYLGMDEHPAMVAAHFRQLLPHNTEAEGKLFFAERCPIGHLRGKIGETGAGLVVIDTLGRLLAASQVDDEYHAWQKIIGRLRLVAQITGAHICLLHHSRKTGGRGSLAVLGSQAIAGGVDTIIQIDMADDGTRELFSVNRAGKPLSRRKVKLDSGGWCFTENIVHDPRDLRRDEILKEFWKDSRPKSGNVLSRLTQTPRASTQRVLKGMLDDGELERTSEGYAPPGPPTPSDPHGVGQPDTPE